MRRSIFKVVSLLLLFTLLLTVMYSCKNAEVTDTESAKEEETSLSEGATDSSVESERDTDTDAVSKESSEGLATEDTVTEATVTEATVTEGSVSSSDSSDSDTEESSEGTEGLEGSESDATAESEIRLDIENGDLIADANKYANGVQAFFEDGSRKQFTVKNTEMSLTYNRTAEGDQLVSSLVNSRGVSYIAETMDVFLKMKDGNIYYASDSGENAQVNIYRFGYYYYEALLEGQGFLPENYEISLKQQIDVSAYNKDGLNNVEASESDEGVGFTVTKANDPYFSYNGLEFSASKYNILILTAKAEGNCSGFQLFFSINNESFKEERSIRYEIINDGEFHTYYIILEQNEGYKGTLTGLRFDPSSGEGGGIIFKEMQVGASRVDRMPQFVSMARRFHVYSDKMHHSVQFATTKKTENVAEVGIETRIDVDRVSKLIVKDAAGEHYSLDGVDWASVECVGFDIIDAGIFGYIMPNDAVAGSISVTEEDGEYVILQTRVPEDNALIPSEEKTENANDFYIGSRVYTDEGHDFVEFLYETYCERNPLKKGSIKVTSGNAANEFLGYDAMRGAYVFGITAPTGSFYTPFNNPNKDYKLNFKLISDIDRAIYVMTHTDCHMLECAALMDANMLMLPVPMQVTKNFSEKNGERNLYNLDDPSFSESLFRLTVNKDKRYDYTIINIYQNWGNYPLKQLSSIPFWCPYYHLSTGVTETNCITPWYLTSQVGKPDLNTLPDFRPMSAPYYAGQPQHHNSGSHSWLKYTDAEGKTYASENVNNTIVSYGPTYAEVVMDYLSDDGKIAVRYTHMEMPQTDENRTYYTMEYKVLEDVKISDFRRSFTFYEMTDNEATGIYQKIGYLDANNESKYVAANKSADDEPYYILGDRCPYFTFFEMPGQYDKDTNPEGVISVFADNGPNQMYANDFYEVEREDSRAYGIYYHLQYFGLGPHLAPLTGLDKLYYNLKLAYDKGDRAYIILNSSNIREFTFELGAYSRMTWDMESFSKEAYLEEYAARFGEEEKVKRAISDYFDAVAVLDTSLLDKHHGNYFDFRYEDVEGIKNLPVKDGMVVNICRYIIDCFKKDCFAPLWDEYYRAVNNHTPKFDAVRAQFERIAEALPEQVGGGILMHWAVYANTMSGLYGAMCRLYEAKKERDREEMAQCVASLRKAADEVKNILEYRKCAGSNDFENWYRGDTKLDIPRLLREIENLIGFVQ